MIENIAYELEPGLILPGQRTMQKVRIEPSVASPSSPRKVPESPMSGVPWLPISRAVSPCGPLSEAKTTSVLSSTPSSFSSSRIWPTWWSPSISLSPSACDSLFAAAAAPDGKAPADTPAAAEFIARSPWHNPEKVFALLETFDPVPDPETALRAAPFMPYLSFAPSAWVLPLKFSGGGLSGGGKLMFDSQGNAWVVDNFMPGAQNQDYFWRGHLSKFAPDGTPLSPPVTGFTGGGLLGPGFGLAIDARDNLWTASFAGNWTISHFDKSGKPLSPPESYNLGGKIGQLQGTIVTPDGDIWVADTDQSQLVHIPKGDPSKGEILCHSTSSDPLKKSLQGHPTLRVRHRPERQPLGNEHWRRPRHALPRCRPHQDRDLQRPRRRQSR